MTFRIGQEIISNYNYVYIPKGTRVKVVGVTKTGSLKLDGIPGSYLANKFIARREDREYNLDSTTGKLNDQSSLYIAVSIPHTVDSELNSRDLIEAFLLDYSNNHDGLGDAYCGFFIGYKNAVYSHINQSLEIDPDEYWIVAEIKSTHFIPLKPVVNYL